MRCGRASAALPMETPQLDRDLWPGRRRRTSSSTTTRRCGCCCERHSLRASSRSRKSRPPRKRARSPASGVRRRAARRSLPGLDGFFAAQLIAGREDAPAVVMLTGTRRLLEEAERAGRGDPAEALQPDSRCGVDRRARRDAGTKA